MGLFSLDYFFLKTFFDVDHSQSLNWIVTILFQFNVLFFWPSGMWDLSSLTSDQTYTPCTGKQSLNCWTTREVPFFFSYFYYVASIWRLYLCCNICIPIGIRERKRECGYLRKIKIQSKKSILELVSQSPSTWASLVWGEVKKWLKNIGLGLDKVVFDIYFHKLYPLEIYFYSCKQQWVDLVKTHFYMSYNLLFIHYSPFHW